MEPQRKPPVRGFAWVEDEAAYKSATRQSPGGIIPVISPGDDQRKTRWTRVLAWYGLCAIEPSEASEYPDAQRDDLNLVVVLDPSFGAPAVFYARMNGRPLLFAPEEADSIKRVLKEQSWRSVLFVGRPQTFTVDYIQRLAEFISIPWGILTAWDIQGLSFVVAKLLVQQQLQKKEGAWTVINAMNGTFREIIEDGESAPAQRYSPEQIRCMMLQREWHTLGIVGHGEGGHMNLNPIVLCGVQGDAEVALDGTPIDGCRVQNESRQCKRAPSGEMLVLSFGDIRAHNLYLFSCTGFLMNGELYPSLNSGVLSALEGYAATAAATDRITYIDFLVPQMTLNLLQTGISSGAAFQFINDLHARKYRRRPYMLCGDPSGPAIPWFRLTDTGRIEIPGQNTVIPVRWESWQVPKVVGAKVTNPCNIRLFSGVDTAAVVLDHPSSEVTCLELIDETQRWRQTRELLENMWKRLDRGAWLERAVWQKCEAGIKTSSLFQSAIIQLTEQRLRIEQCLQAAFHHSQTAWDCGVSDSTAERLIEYACLQVGAWDRHFGQLVLDHLLPLEALPSVLTYGFDAGGLGDGSDCSYCKASLTDLRLSAPLSRQGDVYQADCEICSSREVWTDSALRLSCDLSTPLHAGIDATIHITCTGPAIPFPADIPAGLLVIELIDKGRGARSFQAIKEHDGGEPCVMRIPVPGNMSAELHTLNLVFVHGLDVSFQRRRWPAFRDHGVTTRSS